MGIESVWYESTSITVASIVLLRKLLSLSSPEFSGLIIASPQILIRVVSAVLHAVAGGFSVNTSAVLALECVGGTSEINK